MSERNGKLVNQYVATGNRLLRDLGHLPETALSARDHRREFAAMSQAAKAKTRNLMRSAVRRHHQRRAAAIIAGRRGGKGAAL